MEYKYTCSKCYRTFSETSLIVDRNQDRICKCGYSAKRDVEAELAPRKGRKWITVNERWSRSMGVPQASLAEYRKKYPNSVYSDKGLLLVKGRKDKMRQADERGFVELDNRK